MTLSPDIYRDILGEGYTLHWYEVQSVLGRGAFGVTYLAFDKNLSQFVAIKEYFPRDFSVRESGQTVHPTTGENREIYEWGLNRFLREAQTLAKFKHHNIVRVMSVFELNNTAYMVMEYEQGEELSRLYKKSTHLSEKALLDIFLPILDGLKLVHNAGFIHRDIKPANIYLRGDGSPVLIDFGAARMTVGSSTRALTSLVTYGYAPFEQYNESDDKQGPWTDIYALGACLYLAVNGKLPLDALARGSSLLSSGTDPYELVSVAKEGAYSPGFLRAIDRALIFRAQDRPQDVQIWADLLSSRIETPVLPRELYKPPSSVNDEDATVIITRPPSVSPYDNSANALIPSLRPVPRQMPEVENSVRQRKLKAATLALLVITAVVGGVIFVNREEIVQFTNTINTVKEDNQQQLGALLQSADKARKLGKFIESKNGAIYYYLQILAIDPENQVATNRIHEIVELSADGIRSDLAVGFQDKAQRNLKLLQAAVPDSITVLKLLEEVHTAKTNQQDIVHLLQQAEADLKAGRLNMPKDQNALSQFRRVLALAADNLEAKQGINTIQNQLITLAKKDLAKGNVVSLEHNIEDILSINPNSADAKKLRNELNILRAQQREVSELTAQAQRAFAAGNITDPPNNNAYVLYQRALRLDANNESAKQGIQNVEGYLKSLFDKQLAGGDYSSAEMVLTNVEQLMPKSRLAQNIRAGWERHKSSSRPDMDVINEMLGKFKQVFESRDVNALKGMSEFQPNRQVFVQQFFNNYTSFRLDISDVKFVGRERKGTAKIAIMDLLNIRGTTVEPGTWSRFKVVIDRNNQGEWKVFW